MRTRKAARDAAAPGASGVSGASGAASGVARVLPLLSFGTLVTAAVVPLAAALYLATSTTWTAVERALLLRGR